MKKIPTLFQREFTGRRAGPVRDEVREGLEWVLAGGGLATVKIDGSCCMVRGGALFRRYDAKAGRTPPPHAIPCCDPDPVTGHWPHWVYAKPSQVDNAWHLAAFFNAGGPRLADGTYEAIGPHFQGNPYGLPCDVLVRHGADVAADVEHTFDGICGYLRDHAVEGLVFWRDGEPACKIRRRDFGLPWPVVSTERTPSIERVLAVCGNLKNR